MTTKTSLPPLYSLNANGSIQQWAISVDGCTITTSKIILNQYGKIGGKIQTTEDTVKSGKSIGRSNETSCEEQALADATSQWEKKLKIGYSLIFCKYAEFKITGIKSGRGRMTDCAIFTCTNKNGDLFDCKMEGSLEKLKDILLDSRNVIGKMLTVRYQGFTNGNMPRFPIGVSVRDYE